ncbi:MAG: hypothetical protein ACPGII_07440, partial [Opitutales bacterium]
MSKSTTTSKSTTKTNDTLTYETDRHNWLNLKYHLFQIPQDNDISVTLDLSPTNIPTNSLMTYTENLKEGHEQVKDIYNEFHDIFASLQEVPREKYAKHTGYTTNFTTLTDNPTAGYGPCKKKFRPIIFALKDFIAAYHPIFEPNPETLEPNWYFADLLTTFCTKMVMKEPINIGRLRDWAPTIKHRNFISLLQYHSPEMKSSWYIDKCAQKLRDSMINSVISDEPLSTSKKNLKERFAKHNESTTQQKKPPKFNFPNQDFSFTIENKTSESDTKGITELGKYLEEHPNSRPSTALIDKNLQKMQKETREQIEEKYDTTSDTSSILRQKPLSLDPNAFQPRIMDQSTILTKRHYKDDFRENNTMLQELQEFGKKQNTKNNILNRNTIIVSRENQHDIQRSINDSNKTHTSRFVTNRDLSFQWDTLPPPPNDNEQENTVKETAESNLMKILSTQPIDTTIINFVHNQISQFTATQANNIISTLLRGLTMKDIQHGCLPYILQQFPQYESFEFCVIHTSNVTTGTNWTKEEAEIYRQYQKINHFGETIRYDDVRHNKSFNLQFALRPYFAEFQLLKTLGRNPAVLCKFFMDKGIDKRLHNYIIHPNFNINYNPSNFKYVIERLYCLEALKIRNKLDDKITRFQRWRNTDNATYVKYTERFIRNHRRIIDLLILQARLNQIQKYHTQSYSLVDLKTRYNISMHAIMTQFVIGIASRKLKQNVIRRIRTDVTNWDKLQGKIKPEITDTLFTDIIQLTLPTLPKSFRCIPYLANIIHNEGQKLTANNLTEKDVLIPITYRTNNTNTGRQFRQSRSYSSNTKYNNSNRGRFSRNNRRFSRSNTPRRTNNSRSRTPRRNFPRNSSKTPTRSILKSSTKRVSFGNTPSWKKSNYDTNNKSNMKSN